MTRTVRSTLTPNVGYMNCTAKEKLIRIIFSHSLKLVKFKGHKMGLLSSTPAFELGLVIQKLTENSQICPIYRSLHTLELHYIHKRGGKHVKHLVYCRFALRKSYMYIMLTTFNNLIRNSM